MNVFVIIVSFNGMEWYDRCLGSLRDSTIPITTVVIDNASSDGSIEYIKEHYPEVVLIESKENLGFGKGNNVGIIYALNHDCDYVFLLNQDAWIEPDTLDKLISIHKNHPEYGLLSPMHLNVDGTGLVMKCFCQQPDNEKLITDLYLNQLSDIYETSYIHAAAWLLPRNSLETVGGFDPIYKHYEEDDDYLNRVRFHQLKIGVCPSARIVHDHRGTSNNPFNTKSRYHHEQELLVNLTNINSSTSVNDYVLYFLKKALVSFVRCKVILAKGFWEDLIFVIRAKRSVKRSREQNMLIARSWLE